MLKCAALSFLIELFLLLFFLGCGDSALIGVPSAETPIISPAFAAFAAAAYRYII
jgi:hypothetical protein